ncbi:hypothetical protein ACGFIF_15645 [Kribbella sp. NPDC049174]|uniref:hypothetical protein n=1 Tax=Kribbella sp. NPDC049174 TaxID=3364112 RepID=UPI003722C403
MSTTKTSAPPLRTRIELEPDLTVVGEAGSGPEAVEVVERLAPDVVVVDLNLPGMPRVWVTRHDTAQA